MIFFSFSFWVQKYHWKKKIQIENNQRLFQKSSLSIPKVIIFKIMQVYGYWNPSIFLFFFFFWNSIFFFPLLKKKATVQQVKSIINEIDVHSSLFIHELSVIQKQLSDHPSSSTSSPQKKRKTKSEPEQKEKLNNKEVEILVAVLELLEFKENVSDQVNLIPVLFDLLSQILNADSDCNFFSFSLIFHFSLIFPSLLNQLIFYFLFFLASLEHVKQLILSSLLNLIRFSLHNEISIDERQFRVDLIVQSIRGSENAQTHQAGLLCMGAIAEVVGKSGRIEEKKKHTQEKEKDKKGKKETTKETEHGAEAVYRVLSHIMPVFTFMGANVLRLDDNYSFLLIQQTLNIVIPPLVAYHITHSTKRLHNIGILFFFYFYYTIHHFPFFYWYIYITFN